MILKCKNQNQIELIEQYYPTVEILEYAGDKSMFLPIDIWMLGKSMQRMFSWAGFNEDIME